MSEEKVVQPEEKLDEKFNEKTAEKVEEKLEQQLKEELKERENKSFWEKLKRLAKDVLVPVSRLIVKPIEWVGDKITLAFMPKESKIKMYDDAVKRAEKEATAAMKNAIKEDAGTISKKMQIIRDEKKTDIEQMTELASLCYKSGKNVTVKTQMGAFMFEKAGQSVLIKHAAPKKRTQESNISYNFQTVGGVAFSKSNRIIEKEVDLFDAVKQLRMDKGFDTHVRELDPEAVIESNLILDVDKDMENGKEIQPENIKEIEQNVLEGNQEAVLDAVLDEIDVPDYEAGTHFEFTPITPLTPEQIEELERMNQQVEEEPEYAPVPPEMQLSAPMMFTQPEPECWKETEYPENDIDTMISRAKVMAKETEAESKMPEIKNDLER